MGPTDQDEITRFTDRVLEHDVIISVMIHFLLEKEVLSEDFLDKVTNMGKIVHSRIYNKKENK